jgi:hypothetical protein
VEEEERKKMGAGKAGWVHSEERRRKKYLDKLKGGE